MDNKFLQFWFEGFDTALSALDESAAKSLLCECGKGCARSYTREQYENIYVNSSDLDDFFEELKSTFGELEAVQISDSEYELTYLHCLCDIVSRGFVKNPRFCECSRSNIICNWEAIFGKGNVEVETKSTILGGADKCVFSIKINRQITLDK